MVGVVVRAPVGGQHLCLLEPGGQLGVQQFDAKTGVEGLNVGFCQGEPGSM